MPEADKANISPATHMRIHKGEKPLQCEFCDYRSGDASNMSKHRKSKLLHLLAQETMLTEVQHMHLRSMSALLAIRPFVEQTL